VFVACYASNEEQQARI